MMRGQSQNVCIKLEKIFVSIENIAEIMGGSHRDHQQYYGHCGQLRRGSGQGRHPMSLEPELTIERSIAKLRDPTKDGSFK